MKTVTRIVRIELRNNPSVFELINKEAFGVTSLRLGSTVSSVQHLLSRSEELRVLMPTLIGCSPIDSSWQDKVGTYLNDFFMEIPKNGLSMNISYNVDFGDIRTKDALTAYEKSLGKKDDSLDKEGWVVGNITGNLNNGYNKVDEEDLYKYVTFINPEQYINYRMCLKHSKVANSYKDINKSTNIEFYLTSEEQIRENKREKTRIKNEAFKIYNEFISDSDTSKINHYVIASNLVGSVEYYKTLNFEDKCALLLDMCNNEPAKFINLKKDSNITIRAQIIMYMWYNILKTLPNSTVIVDASNPEKIIGNTMNEAISYMSNELNRAHIADLNNRYKSLKEK